MWRPELGKSGERAVLEERLLTVRLERLKNALEKVNEEIVSKQEKVIGISAKIKKIGKAENGVISVKKNCKLHSKGDVYREQKSAESILPPEVWLSIFSFLDNSEDLSSCNATCALFQDLLMTSQSVWLFHGAFPHLFPYLSRDDILKCRRVCRRWNNVIDTFFEDHVSSRPYQSYTRGVNNPCLAFISPMEEKGIGVYFKDSGRTSSKVLGEMERHPRNPFIGRSVTIDNYNMRLFSAPSHNVHCRVPERSGIQLFNMFDRMEEQDGIRCQGVINFLEKFGEHIFNFTYSPRFTCGQATKKFISNQLLRYLPNVRYLSLQISFQDKSLAGCSIDPESYPNAPNLETIAIDTSTFHLILVAMVKKYRAQLKRLHVNSEGWSRHLSHLHFPQLTELHVESISRDGLLSLTSLKSVSLRKLGLSLVYGDSKNFETLMYVLNCLCTDEALPNLEALRFSFRCSTFQNVIDFTDIGNSTKNLAHLYAPQAIKYLEIQTFHPRLCPDDPASLYTFLVRFPFLRALNIHCTHRSDGDYDVEQISYLDFFTLNLASDTTSPMGGNEIVEMTAQSMYKSNIWKILPRLQMFTFERKVYYRHIYEAAAEK